MSASEEMLAHTSQDLLTGDSPQQATSIHSTPVVQNNF